MTEPTDKPVPSEPSVPSSEDTSAPVAPVERPVATVSFPDLLIALNEESSSGQKGWAALTAKGDQTEVVLSLPAGTMESEAVHIHAGACGKETLGAVAQGLSKVVDGVSVTTVNATLSSLRTGGFAINAHKKGDPAVFTACGNIPTATDSLTLSLLEENSSGQRGWATLTTRGTKTEVVMYLPSGSLESEAVHIHAGACGKETLGAVANGLTKFVGGSGGSVSLVDTTLDNLRTGSFAINAHKKGEPAVYTACGNIPAKATTQPTATGAGDGAVGNGSDYDYGY